MRTYVNKSSKERGAMQTLYFNTEQTRELLGISDFALILMQYYVAIAHQPNAFMEDGHLANMLNKPERTVKSTRLALTKAGWFRRTKTTVSGVPHITYDVGKEAVNSNSPYAKLGAKT